MKRVISFILITVMCMAFSSCQHIVTEECTDVMATVTEKEYKDSYVTMVPVYNGKTTTLRPQHHPSKYYITITYEGVTKRVNSKNLYESVKEGDSIQMILYKGYDEEGNLVKQELLFPE